MKRYVTFDTGDKTYHLGISYSNPSVLSAGSPGRIRRIAGYLDKVNEIIESDRGLVTVHGDYKGLPVTAFSTGMGPASVSITMPEIIEACDEPNMVILRLGTAGGLRPELNIGDFVVTTDVERAESTCDKIMGSGYKARSYWRARKELIACAKRFKKDFQNIHVGCTRVTDDIYFDALTSKERGPSQTALAVSMEFSVYCALRDRYKRDYKKNIEVGELLVISDNLFREGEQIDMTEFLERQKQIEEAQIITGLETLIGLQNNQ